MQVVEDLQAMQSLGRHWRQQGARVAFVPTMGNLHQGHLHLVREAARLADRVIVSIFVNPTQFGPNEDFAAYPRTLDRDLELLRELQVDAVFTPDAAAMYPQGFRTEVTVRELSEGLCGAGRPGHFAGVATVVLKLLNIVQPQLAVFGEKDRQQLLVIRQMVHDLCVPVEIHGVATIREDDGLAMSSRNRYLGEDERRRAPALYQTLCGLCAALQGGERDHGALCRQAREALTRAGFTPEYVEIRREADLAAPGIEEKANLVILAAARLGQTRLIDNVFCPLGG